MKDHDKPVKIFPEMSSSSEDSTTSRETAFPFLSSTHFIRFLGAGLEDVLAFRFLSTSPPSRNSSLASELLDMFTMSPWISSGSALELDARGNLTSFTAIGEEPSETSMYRTDLVFEDFLIRTVVPSYARGGPLKSIELSPNIRRPWLRWELGGGASSTMTGDLLLTRAAKECKRGSMPVGQCPLTKFTGISHPSESDLLRAERGSQDALLWQRQAVQTLHATGC